MTWQDFVDVATKVAHQEGYPIGVLLGQAALETGRDLGSAMGNNFFGIKGSGSAGTQRLRTQEADGNNFYNTVANFAAYANPEDSIRAYINLIRERYPQAWALRNDPIAMVKAIKEGGYATDPQYIAKVTNTPEFKAYADQRIMAPRTAEYVGESGDFGKNFMEYDTAEPVKKKTIMDTLWDYVFPKADASYDPTNPGGVRNYAYQGYQPNSQGTINYTVRPGDTLWDIAQQYGLGGNNWNQIRGYSGSPNALPVGAQLQIPQQKTISYNRPQPQQNYTPANANYSSQSAGGPAYSPPPPVKQYSQPVSQPSAQLNFRPAQTTGGYQGTSPNNLTTKSGLKLTI